MTPRKRMRRDKIVAVARSLFSGRGVRGTTMERVAADAGISKVTLYGYFSDKDALFLAVAQDVATQMYTEFADALEGDGPLEMRVTRALTDKHALVFEVVRHSPFAAELFAAKDRVAREILQQCDRDIENLLAVAFAEDGKPTRQSTSTARVLFGAAMGVANRAQARSQLGADIKMLVQSVLTLNQRSLR